MADETSNSEEPISKPAAKPEGDEAKAEESKSAEPAADAPKKDAVPIQEKLAPAVAPIPVAVAHPKRYGFLALVSIITLALDLGTKEWAKTHVAGPRPGSNGPHLIFALAHNPGGAFGLLGDESKMIREPFFLLISVAAVVFIVSLYRKLTPPQTALRWGLPLVLGGALGNLHDRVRFSQVVDFIDAYWRSGPLKESHWPTFNIADIAIVAGVILMGIDMFQTRKPKAPAPAPASAKLAEISASDGAPPSLPAPEAGSKASD